MTSDARQAGRALIIHPEDTVAVALVNLPGGTAVELGGHPVELVHDVPAKHKFALQPIEDGEPVRMYGVVVGTARGAIRRGERITTENVCHTTTGFRPRGIHRAWNPPDVSKWSARTFDGYRRADGQVGTRNFWLVFPLVFCENRNVRAMQEAFEKGLGLSPTDTYRRQVSELSTLYSQGDFEAVRNHPGVAAAEASLRPRTFPNVDGVKFLLHEGGCGGTREDAQILCGLLAGYLHHPNVAGATVLSLGCQNAQIEMLRAEIARRDPGFRKPLLIFDQQENGLESAMLSRAIHETFLGLMEADRMRRSPVPLSHLRVGLKCGGSDGFSGLTANPAVGEVSDLIAALGGTTILSEFPELCGVEQELIDRCQDDISANRFCALMQGYAARAAAVGTGFDMNPSPGNIRDGLITDAMKSAGAVKKGGSSPVSAVLDYPEYAEKPGLNLLCTPGNDVEAVTGQVGAGATVVLFTTGLGTPTGNPIAPVIKISSNTALAGRMTDIIDFDCGGIVSRGESIKHSAEALLELIIEVAGGRKHTRAELLLQDDFIPWKRGISL